MTEEAIIRAVVKALLASLKKKYPGVSDKAPVRLPSVGFQLKSKLRAALRADSRLCEGLFCLAAQCGLGRMPIVESDGLLQLREDRRTGTLVGCVESGRQLVPNEGKRVSLPFGDSRLTALSAVVAAARGAGQARRRVAQSSSSQLPKLQGFDRNLTSARAAFYSDRIWLAALAWTLGTLQVKRGGRGEPRGSARLQIHDLADRH